MKTKDRKDIKDDGLVRQPQHVAVIQDRIRAR